MESNKVQHFPRFSFKRVSFNIVCTWHEIDSESGYISGLVCDRRRNSSETLELIELFHGHDWENGIATDLSHYLHPKN